VRDDSNGQLSLRTVEGALSVWLVLGLPGIASPHRGLPTPMWDCLQVFPRRANRVRVSKIPHSYHLNRVWQTRPF